MTQHQPIVVLSDDLASQIAAGEVVERPASVVKELVENALDAGARRIEVAIEGGGITSIRVADDGHGMRESDVPLSLGRHATSKLRALSDLERIASYGFRGEALPSVASVSRLSIRTRARGAEGGVLLEAEGTTLPSLSPIGSPIGTTLEVRDLFFNVPARRKFLRSSNTESGHVGEVIVDAALSRPEVSFLLERDGRRVKTFDRVSDRATRVQQVLVEEDLARCAGERGPLSVEAFLSRPERGRQGAGSLRILVNGRPVRDRALAATIAHSYRGALERGRYPRGVVYLELPGSLVDVNVHPQKTEVRFADARAVADALFSVVSQGLVQKRFVDGKANGAASHGVALQGVPQRAGSATSNKKASSGSGSTAIVSAPESLGGGQKAASKSQAATRVLREGGAPVSGARYAAPLPAPRADSVKSPPQRTGATYRGLRLLGVARQRYLVCEGEEGVVLLDQHAAHERVLLSELRRDFFAGSVASQSLLFPEVVALSRGEIEVIEGWDEVLRRLGLDVRVRGEESVSIHSAPRLVARMTAEVLLRQLICDLTPMDRAAPDVEPVLRHLACAEAIRPGERLAREAAEGLLRSLLGVDFDVACRHGRVVLSTLSGAELERKAGRS